MSPRVLKQMPYKRSYKRYSKFPRKFYGTHYRYAKAWGNAGQKASRALAMAFGLKKQLNVEYKHFDVTTSSAISSTPSVVDLTAIIEGADNDERNGRSIKLSSLYMRGLYTMSASATRSSVRTVLVLDRRPDAGTPTYADVFTGNTMTALREIDSLQGRFKILSDVTSHMTSGNNEIITFDKYIRLPGIKTKYDGTAAANVSKNAIYLMQISSEPTNTISQSLVTRIRYIDN